MKMKPHKLDFFDTSTVMHIAAYGCASVIVTDKGTYSFGANFDGMLGLNHKKEVTKPNEVNTSKIPKDYSIRKIVACTNCAFMLISKDGEEVQNLLHKIANGNVLTDVILC